MTKSTKIFQDRKVLHKTVTLRSKSKQRNFKSNFHHNYQSQACNLIEKETPRQMSFCEFLEIIKNIFILENFRVTASSNRRYTELKNILAAALILPD